MVAQQRQRAVGTFPNRQAAEAALQELKTSGFPMDKVSVLAKDADRDEQIGGAEVKDHGNNESQEGAGIGAVTGTALGGLGGLLVGLEALVIPGVGPFLAAGTIATTLAGAGIGAAAGSIVGALTGLGIPEDQAQAYNEQVSQGGYLVIVEGSAAEIDRAGSILSSRGIRGWNVYDNPGGQGSSRPATGSTANVNPAVDPTNRTNVDRTATTSGSDEVEIIDRRDQAYK